MKISYYNFVILMTVEASGSFSHVVVICFSRRLKFCDGGGDDDEDDDEGFLRTKIAESESSPVSRGYVLLRYGRDYRADLEDWIVDCGAP